MTGTLWYSFISLVRRVRITWPVYCSIGAASSLIFVVVGLNTMARRQTQMHLLADVENGNYLQYTSAWLMGMGVLVSFLHTQMLMQRLVEDRYIEFGALVNIGIPRAIVAFLVSLEQLGYAIAGGGAGIVIGLALIGLASLSQDFILPTASNIMFASLIALTVPIIAVFPVTIILLVRLLRSSGGISRVR